jgi:hypothetical protein
MMPKEKAIEIFNCYKAILYTPENKEYRNNIGKICALNCVDIILDCLKFNSDLQYHFWQQVKKEIEKI